MNQLKLTIDQLRTALIGILGTDDSDILQDMANYIENCNNLQSNIEQTSIINAMLALLDDNLNFNSKNYNGPHYSPHPELIK